MSSIRVKNGGRVRVVKGLFSFGGKGCSLRHSKQVFLKELEYALPDSITDTFGGMENT